MPDTMGGIDSVLPVTKKRRLKQMTKPYVLQPDFITAVEATTLPGLFAARVQRSSKSIAYQQYESQSDTWRDFCWQEVQVSVARWQVALARENLQPGDRVASLVKNSVAWVCFEQAAQSLGLVIVALYVTDTPNNLSYILNDAGVRLLLVEELTQWHELADSGAKLPDLQRVWSLQEKTSASRHGQPVCYINDILPSEAASYENKVTVPDALATIIYTSGTTGRPKGVMLSHRNILANAEAVQNFIPAYPDDIFLSFLPLAHGFERTVNYYLPMMAGSRISYVRSIKLLAEDLLVIQPTVFLSPPRLYEKIYSAVQEKVAPHWLKRKLLSAAITLGWQKFEAQQQQRPPLGILQSFLHFVLHKLVAKKILSHLGGHLRIAVTGAAPMSTKVIHFFIGLGFPLVEGYGLTEAGPVVCANSPEQNRPGSVGRPLPGVQVMTSNDGELLVQSAGVMQGYWHQAQATRDVIDENGWLHTGDLAEIKGDIIYIRGRCKDILVTSTGEKVSPADMEMAITLDPLFEQAMVVGEAKPFIGALLVLNKAAWKNLAKELQVEQEAGDALQSPVVIEVVLHKLAVLLRSFPVYSQVHAVFLSCDAWTIENGLLTPTLKIKRHELEIRFAREIDDLYRGHVLVD